MKSIIKFVLPVVLLFCQFGNGFAQRAWRSYEWANYELEFELPDNYIVTSNTIDELAAEGDGLKFVVYPLDGKANYQGDLEGFVVKMSEQDLKLDEIDDFELLDVDGFEAGFLTAVKGKIQYMVFGLKDLDNNNRFYGFVAFEEEKEQIVEDALEVFLSFGKL